MKAKHIVLALGAFLLVCCLGLLVFSTRDMLVNDQIGKIAQRTPREPSCVVAATLDDSLNKYLVYIQAEGEGSSSFCSNLTSNPQAVGGFTASYRMVSAAPAYTVWCHKRNRHLYITLISNEIAAMSACDDLLP